MINVIQFSDLYVGKSLNHSFTFTESVVNQFSKLVGDFAPVHTDAMHAKSLGYQDRIVHGLFLQSILSGLIGEELPGINTVIVSTSIKFYKPVYIEETVEYGIEIQSLTDSVSAVSLKFEGKVKGIEVFSGKIICTFP
jgi:acyl dehydratase